MRTADENGRTVVFLEGAIHSENAEALKQELLRIAADAPGEILLDAENLTSISSAGLRALLALAHEKQQKVTLRNAGPEIYETLEITGFTEIMNVQRKMRKVSIDSCKKIGQGALGDVYRLTPDSIVKVFTTADSLPLVRRELARARQAFVKGLPTAIPFDIVQVGEQYGAIYELLNAESVNDCLIRDPGHTDELVRKYVQLMRQVHATEALPGELPPAAETFLEYVEELKDILPAEMAERLRELLKRMPQNLHLIHGDLQMKNVLTSGGDMLLIDLETLCTGDPVFDLQAIYMAYILFNVDEPDNSDRFLGISCERCTFLWERILAEYFQNDTPEQIREKEKRIQVLGCIRFLDRVVTHHMTLPELKEIRVRHTLEQLETLLKSVDTLTIA